MLESSAILYPDDQYTLDFAGLGRPNGKDGLTHPGDIDKMYGNLTAPRRWLFGEVKRAGANFNKGQLYFHLQHICDLRPEALFACLTFTREQIRDGRVYVIGCKVVNLFHKPKDATQGSWLELNNHIIKPIDLIAWTDKKPLNKVALLLNENKR